MSLKKLTKIFLRKPANIFFRFIRLSPDFNSWFDGMLRDVVLTELRQHKSRLNSQSQPELGLFWHDLKDIEIIKRNLKMLGLSKARELYSSIQSDSIEDTTSAKVTSSLCKQSDFYSPWFKYWCNQLKLEPIFHRKVWEYAFVLQALSQAGFLKSGKRAIGFGCGQEPIASYLASIGIEVVVTDLPLEKSKDMGWIETNQHTSSLDQVYYPDLISSTKFKQLVKLDYVDMNDIPDSYAGQFDFCWSICAMEHLGSISKGLRFVKESMKVLVNGGLSVHTTEYNIDSGDTIDNWQTVLFQKHHLEALRDDLNASDYNMLPFDSDPGNAFLDGYFDLPPYNEANINSAHLKLSVDGFAATCAGLIVEK